MEILIPISIVVVIGLIAGLILALVGKFFGVSGDERVEAVRDALPGANCGGCGFSGCDGFAEAVVNDGIDIIKCVAANGDTVKEIAAIMGVEAGPVRKRVAVVRCGGVDSKSQTKFQYDGLKTCHAAAALGGGYTGCSFGCLGFGDCVKVCDNDAIAIVDGIAKVVRALCIGCMKCGKACPRSILALGYADAPIVTCLNTQKGAETRKVCTAGCIGCMKCVKNCETGAIKVENFVAYIDGDKCISCGKCLSGCPVGAIQLA